MPLQIENAFAILDSILLKKALNLSAINAYLSAQAALIT